jgi:hypothetical protein
MRRQSKLWGKVVLSATLALSMVMVAVPAMADTSSDSWDFSSGLRVEVGGEVQIGELTVPDPAGAECTAEVEQTNGSSVHLGHNVNVYLNGTLLVSLQGVEDEPFKFSSDSAGFISSGSDQLTVFLEATQDRVASSAGNLTVTCTPPDDGGGEGCTPGYWKQLQHFDSWTGYSPTDDYETVFGVDASFTLDLLGALEQGGGGEAALGRHAVAGLLNSASGGVSYDYSTAEVIALVQAAYASGDFEGAKDLLAAANESGCPLN